MPKDHYYIATDYLKRILSVLQQQAQTRTDNNLAELQHLLQQQHEFSSDRLFHRLLSECYKHTDTTTLALTVGSSLTLEHHGFLGYAAKSSPNIKTAVLMDIKYLQTQMSILKFDYLEHAHCAAIDILFLGEAQHHKRFLSECVLASFSTMLRQLINIELSGDLFLEYSPHLTLCKELSNVKLHANAQHTKFVFDKNILDMKISSYDSNLLRLTERQCHQIVSQLPTYLIAKTPMIERVKKILNTRLEQNIRQNQIAEQLHISARTLKRYLHNHGTSYQQLLDQMRFQRAQDLLEDSRYNLDHIAQQLGYSSAASFSKAFKRWSGTTPHQYRKQITNI